MELTVSCSNCKGQLHLPCIGIFVKADQLISPNIKIQCNECVNKLPKIDTQTTAPPQQNATPPTTVNVNEMQRMIEEMGELRKLVISNSDQLNVIEGKTTVIMEKVTKQPNFETTTTQTKDNTAPALIAFTPKSNAKSHSISRTQAQSYASATRYTEASQTPKRRRQETIVPSIVKKNAPPAKTGTKSSACGLAVVPKPAQKEKPQYSKAVWVSRFAPDTTIETITDYIRTETHVNDESPFMVHKLIKKDQDLSTLKFVSFKIMVNDDNFEILMDPDVWPHGILVREFTQNHTLGDHIFPALNAKNQKTSTQKMDFESTSDNQQQPSQKPKSPITLT